MTADCTPRPAQRASGQARRLARPRPSGRTPPYLVLARDVRPDGEGSAASRPDLLGHSLRGSRGRDLVDRHVGSGSPRRLRHTETDSRARSRDRRRLPLQRL